MAKKSDDIVLRILRDIQETLAGHSTEFKKIQGDLKDLRETTLAAAGLAFKSAVKSDNLQNQIDSIEDRLKQVEKKISEKA